MRRWGKQRSADIDAATGPFADAQPVTDARSISDPNSYTNTHSRALKFSDE
ncbi:hypothetical protein [Qipengyuania aquimaris]|uniref:hypothetical protein n=1 Tax=Qipengyuania aquimaris TaxID=255984 RepID=UPI001F428A1B|nr:hypothetical protein [Qipengyuania aquimaris]